MTFDLVRLGWPNFAVVAALAVLPILSLTTATDTRPKVTETETAVRSAMLDTGTDASE